MPRVKPPRTVDEGLFGMPTDLNNVETFANVPMIINNGAAWYKSIGPEKSPGTKTFALTGSIAHTGLIEVPMGMTLREVIYDIGGGIREGGEFKAVQIGGPSGGCLTKDHLDLHLDFDSLKSAGAIIGSGGLVVMDSNTCMVEIARFFMHFTQKESCGKCVPCREGTKRMLEILERITNGQGRAGDIELLLELGEMVESMALCGLGKTAPGPVLSTIKYFRGEYEAHIGLDGKGKRCPVNACRKLRPIRIAADRCKGCGKCEKNCPVQAISPVSGWKAPEGSKQTSPPRVIDEAKCIKCGTCVDVCPFKAVEG
jgi:NADH-quinone oxidoreductase subunit F